MQYDLTLNVDSGSPEETHWVAKTYGSGAPNFSFQGKINRPSLENGLDELVAAFDKLDPALITDLFLATLRCLWRKREFDSNRYKQLKDEVWEVRNLTCPREELCITPRQ